MSRPPRGIKELESTPQFFTGTFSGFEFALSQPSSCISLPYSSLLPLSFPHPPPLLLVNLSPVSHFDKMLSLIINLYYTLLDCAAACLANANLNGCIQSDTHCLCTNQAFVSSTTGCITAACSGADLQNALSFSQALCAAVVRLKGWIMWILNIFTFFFLYIGCYLDYIWHSRCPEQHSGLACYHNCQQFNFHDLFQCRRCRTWRQRFRWPCSCWLSRPRPLKIQVMDAPSLSLTLVSPITTSFLSNSCYTHINTAGHVIFGSPPRFVKAFV